jgi:hypothetical protein
MATSLDRRLQPPSQGRIALGERWHCCPSTVDE